MKKLIKSIRNTFESWSGKIQDILDVKLSAKGTGKIFSPKETKKILFIAGGCLAISFLIVSFVEDDEYVGDGIKKLSEEKSVKFGKTQLERVDKIEIEDPLAELEEVDEEAKCFELKAQVERGVKLNTFDKDFLDNCIKNGIFNLSEREKKILKALNSDDLTDAEREMYRKALEGDEAASELVDALLSGDKNRIAAAKKIINDKTLTPEEIAALKKVASGEIKDQDLIDALLSDDPELRKKAVKAIETGDKSLLKEIKDKANKENKVKEGDVKVEDIKDLDTKEKMKVAGDVKKRIEDRAKKISEVKHDVDKLREKLKKNGVFEKIANGEPLTPEEQKLYDDFVEKSKQLKDLEEAQKKDILLYKSIIAELNKDLKDLGFKPIGEDGFIEKFAKIAENTNKVIIDDEGNRITPSMYRLIQEKLANVKNEESFEKSIFGNISAGVLKDAKVTVSGLSVYERNPLDAVMLNPNLRIPVVLETTIYVSSNNSEGKRVVLRVLDNVMDPDSDEVLIPIGTKLIGKTGTFDEETKLIDIKELNKVYIDNKSINIAFDVMTSDGRTGVPGGVKSTRKEKITAAVLSQFASSMTEYFALVVQDQADGNTSLDPLVAATAGGLNGASGGFDKLSEMLVQDFENAAAIFYAPRGMKLIISPR